MLRQKDLKILREYYDIYIPQPLREFDDYDFIADNTFLSGIVEQVLEGNILNSLDIVVWNLLTMNIKLPK